MLENLERTQEGLGTGVREVLAELAAGASPLSEVVIGLVADSLRVPREVAPLIDIVLGDVASHFVVRDSVALTSALPTARAVRRPSQFSADSSKVGSG